MFKKFIIDKSESIKEELIQIRRTLHANPELGYKELETSDLIAEKLNTLGIEVKRGIGGTGVLGILKGGKPGKTVMLRADMDALQMPELNDVPYKSKNEGLMHGCGHDSHITWLLGAATILADMKDDIQGIVKFIFQPAEEGLMGAVKCIEDGILENPPVDAVFGAHVWPNIESGKIGIRNGSLMSGPDDITITIHGKGGHSAEPHNTNDPIAMACQVYMGLQTIVSRRVDPTESVVIAIATFNGGEAKTVIPDDVVMTGTARVVCNKMREELPKRIESIVKGITEAHGGSYTLDYEKKFPVLINTPSEYLKVRETCELMLGEENVIELENPSMASEDFAYYLEEVPGAFFFVGTRNEEKGLTGKLHNSYFNIDEDILHKTSALFAELALQYLNK
jgi:amidohydrolase